MFDSLENAKRKQEGEQELDQLHARSSRVRLALIDLIRHKADLELYVLNKDYIFTGFTSTVKVPQYPEYIVRLFIGVRHNIWFKDTSLNDSPNMPLSSIDDNRDVAIQFEIFDKNDTKLTTPITREGYTLFNYHVIHPIDSSDGQLAFGLRKRYDDKTVTVDSYKKQGFISRLDKLEEVLDLLVERKKSKRK